MEYERTEDRDNLSRLAHGTPEADGVVGVVAGLILLDIIDPAGAPARARARRFRKRPLDCTRQPAYNTLPGWSRGKDTHDEAKGNRMVRG